MHRTLALFAIFVTVLTGTAQAADRLDTIRRRGVVTCGIFPFPGVAGFAVADAEGRYTGLDIDICRALSAAIFGTPDRVRFVPAPSVAEFKRSGIDVVARRLTWELRREQPLGLLFGPITFYDGQGFLVSNTGTVSTLRDLDDVPVCVASGTVFEDRVRTYFTARGLRLRAVPLDSEHAFDEIAMALETGRCRGYSADVSQLGAIRSRMSEPGTLKILSEQISKEPLAPLVREEDQALLAVLRWTIFALIEAEELGITRANLDAMRASQDPDVQRLLGVQAGNGKAIGLRESWAYDVLKALGNYGEIFDRNVGSSSAVKLDRGLNNLWSRGGLMYAPPLR